MGGEKVELDTDLVSRLVAVLERQSVALERLEAKLDGQQKSFVTVREAADMLACGKEHIFDLLKASKLKRGPRFGKETTVTMRSIERAMGGGGGRRSSTSANKFEPFTVADLQL
jgi:hypothetical protein